MINKKIVTQGLPVEKPTTYYTKTTNINNYLPPLESSTLYFIKGDTTGQWDLGSQIEIGIIPQSVSYDYKPNFSEFDMLGRTSPVFLYTGGSDKTLSFSITIHEDMEDIRKYGNIVEFVDKLKALSYPSKTTDGLSYLKNVYFQLGSLTGTCIVNTSVGWKKPFRQGRYIVADISFTITIITAFPEVTSRPLTPDRVIDEDTIGQFEGIIYSGITTEQYSTMSNYLSSQGYNTNINDLISIGDTEVSRQAQLQQAFKTFEYNVDKLDNIYNAFAKVDDQAALNNLIRPVVNFYNTRGQDLITSNRVSIGTDKVAANVSAEYNRLKNIEKNIVKYLDHYYKNVNLDLTVEQRNLIEEQLLQTIAQLKDALDRIVKYGASN